MIETKYGTQDWDKRVNLSIFSVIVVDTWNVYHGILGDKNEELEKEFYESLTEEMIDNKFDEVHNTRKRRLEESDGVSNLDTRDGYVASGVGVHLTPTKKRRCVKGELTNYIQQDWCKGCTGERFKTIYVCLMCREQDNMNLAFCHTKTGRLCFRDHIKSEHNQE